MKCWLFPRSSQKRESGESPERSGHCNRGANLRYPIVHSMRRGRRAMSLKSGNLLCMARLNFRVKCNNQLGDIRSPRVLSAYWKQAFFYGIRLFVWIIPAWSHGGHRGTCEPFKGMIKWQAILLRMHSFPPHIWTDSLSTPEWHRAPQKTNDRQHDWCHSCFFYVWNSFFIIYRVFWILRWTHCP